MNHARRDQPRPDHALRPDGRDVRAAILDATEHLLAGQSFESLSVAGILAAAAVSRGSFYFYFPNKHAVLAELVRRAVGSARAAAATWADDDSGPPGAALREGTREGGRLWREHAPVLRAIVENWRSDPELTRLWTEMMDGFAAVAARRIAADRAAGRAPATGPDPHLLASVLTWMGERAYYLAAVGQPGFTDETALADTLTHLWSAAIYTVPPGPAADQRSGSVSTP